MKNTRELLLDKGLEFFIKKGYHNTGIQEVLSSVGVPKGSFYHYFKSKDHFGKEVIERYAAEGITMARSYFEDSEYPPIERFRNFFVNSRDQLIANHFQGGCLLGNMCEEMSDQCPQFEELLERKMKAMTHLFRDNIKEAQERGEMSKEHDATRRAEFLINSWQGAVLRMKVVKSSRPLDLFIEMAFTYILT